MNKQDLVDLLEEFDRYWEGRSDKESVLTQFYEDLNKLADRINPNLSCISVFDNKREELEFRIDELEDEVSDLEDRIERMKKAVSDE